MRTVAELVEEGRRLAEEKDAARLAEAAALDEDVAERRAAVAAGYHAHLKAPLGGRGPILYPFTYRPLGNSDTPFRPTIDRTGQTACPAEAAYSAFMAVNELAKCQARCDQLNSGKAAPIAAELLDE